MEGLQLKNCRNLSTSFLLLIAITNQVIQWLAKKLLPSMVGSCCWVALLSRLVSCVCLFVPASTIPLCPHGHRDTCPQGRPHTHSYNTSHRYRKPSLCKHLFVHLQIIRWLFHCLWSLDQVCKSCMPAWNWGLLQFYLAWKPIWHLPQIKTYTWLLLRT